jgi:thymidylate kinase
MRGLIIEGVTGAGKTTVLKLVQRRLADERPGCSKLILTEHYTERVLENAKAAGTLSYESVLAHIDDVVSQLEHIDGWKTSSKFRDVSGSAEIIALVERFFGTHVANLTVMLGCGLTSEAFRTAERIYGRLATIGIRVAVLALPEAALRVAVEDTRHRRNDAWRAYLDSIGDRGAVEAYHIRWQEQLLEFYARLREVCDIEIITLAAGSGTYESVSERLFQLVG